MQSNLFELNARRSSVHSVKSKTQKKYLGHLLMFASALMQRLNHLQQQIIVFFLFETELIQTKCSKHSWGSFFLSLYVIR